MRDGRVENAIKDAVRNGMTLDISSVKNIRYLARTRKGGRTGGKDERARALRGTPFEIVTGRDRFTRAQWRGARREGLGEEEDVLLDSGPSNGTR